jgi:endonuclease G
MLKHVFIFIFVLTGYVVSAQEQSKSIQEIEDKISKLEAEKQQLLTEKEDLVLKEIQFKIKTYALPELKEGQEVIEHSAMSLVYNEKHEQAQWVVHMISPEVLKGKVGRSNDFRPDEKVKTGSTVEADYFLKHKKKDGSYSYDGYGFDRGHLAPSADFSWSKKALSESYYYSNMTPQRPKFNRESWAMLEGQFRSYISNNPEAELYVVTGPVLFTDLSKVERSVNQVSLPELHYKIGLDLKNKTAIAFLMPNEHCKYSLSHYAVSIDSIEHLTGINFFHALDDSLEDRLEQMIDLESWLPKIMENEVQVMMPPYLPDGAYNTLQAKELIGKGKKTICGTVVSTKLSSKGNTFLNLDRSFPNQIFTVSIFKSSKLNFSYEPHIILKDKPVCVTGKITDYNNTPSMIVENEEAIEILEIGEEY